MKIFFDKIGVTPKPIVVEKEGIRLEGTLQKSGYRKILLSTTLSGIIDLECDRCGKSYGYVTDGPLKLTLSDVVSEDKDDLDIIEFLDGTIDISYILEGEINAIRESYHYCNTCDNSDESLELEF
jgi:uncharacterized metal-binding protein YceD (DUF177 family)